MKVWIEKTMIPIALIRTSEKFDNNIKFNRAVEKDGRAFQFTITVIDSKGNGASINPITGRRKHACCYHVFLELIKELFKVGATRFKSSQMDIKDIDDLGEACYTINSKSCVGSFYGHVSLEECCNCDNIYD